MPPAASTSHKARSSTLQDIPINEISWRNDLDAFIARRCKQIIVGSRVKGLILIKESWIIIHETDKPDLVPVDKLLRTLPCAGLSSGVIGLNHFFEFS